jgi:hypothetical protein
VTYGEVWRDEEDGEIVMVIDRQSLLILKEGIGFDPSDPSPSDAAGQIREDSAWASPYNPHPSETKNWTLLE